MRWIGKMETHARWKGGRCLMKNGYIQIRLPGRYVYEHRWVMEQYLGRPLAPGECVHHKNQDRTDNRIENLELMTKFSHNQMETRIQWENGQRHHPITMNAHLRKGKVLVCPVCGSEHYEKLSRLNRPYIARCSNHRGKGIQLKLNPPAGWGLASSQPPRGE